MDRVNENLDLSVTAQGRLGNVIYSLSNALFIAKKTKSRLTLGMPNNKGGFLNKQVWDFRPNEEDLREADFRGDKFFKDHLVQREFNIGVPSFTEGCSILRKYLWPRVGSFDYNPKDHDVVLHIRSGDLFGGHKRRDWDHLQPPASFYEKVILDNDFQRPLIVAEPDRKNPAIEELIRRFPNISIQSSSIKDDWLTLCHSTNLICSNSSFALMAAVTSPKVKRCFFPSYACGIPVHPAYNFYKPFVPKDLPFSLELYRMEKYHEILPFYKGKEMLEEIKNFPISRVTSIGKNSHNEVDEVASFMDLGLSLCKKGEFKYL